MVRLHLLPPKSEIPRGDITQLVEWLLCKQHVAGSNPTISTNLRDLYLKHFLIFENRKLEIKENYNSYNEIDNPKGLSVARWKDSIIRTFDYSIISQVSC